MTYMNQENQEFNVDEYLKEYHDIYKDKPINVKPVIDLGELSGLIGKRFMIGKANPEEYVISDYSVNESDINIELRKLSIQLEEVNTSTRSDLNARFSKDMYEKQIL